MKIQTNVAANSALGNISKNSLAAERSIQKLSSGFIPEMLPEAGTLHPTSMLIGAVLVMPTSLLTAPLGVWGAGAGTLSLVTLMRTPPLASW